MASLTATNQDSSAIPNLKLAFCLYKYFPYGGLQRDFIRIATDCQRRGHEIRVYTLQWRGEIPDGFEVVIVPVTAFTNHTRYERFSAWVAEALRRDPVSGVIGINKMPGLDVYFVADSCYEEKAQNQRSWLYRQLPRYKHFARYERSVFANDSQTEILMISEAERPFFEKYYDTDGQRMHFLPPGISSDCIAPANVGEIRRDMRAELGVADDEYMLLSVGSGFIKKGFRRVLTALRALPPEVRNKTRYFVIGEDNPSTLNRTILVLGLCRNVTILAGRDDIPRFLFAADLLLHPALDENAGIILLEAAVAGLPVLATDNCGYAHYIEKADVGCLVKSPFQQAELNAAMAEMMQCDRRSEWRVNGKVFASNANIYALPREASHLIEQVTLDRHALVGPEGTLAFAVYKYFPFGGLQRDFLRIALECQSRGYKIRVYTLSWEGQVPLGFDVVLVPVNSLTNHSRYRKFSGWVDAHLERFPAVGFVGFNKMPGLDIYYAADACYEEKARTQRGQIYRAAPRYKHFSRFERAVFERHAKTEILMISEVQKPLFRKYYDTPPERFHLLPPGISKDRRAPPQAPIIRAELRSEFGIGNGEFFLLMVGSGFIAKGLDRVLLGIASLPEAVRASTRLIAIGQDAPASFERQARRLGIGDQVLILSGRDDIPRFLLGADLLVHPAYVENTGTVLLEAIVAGLPVLATDVCGYAHYIEEAGAGRLISSPYVQQDFDEQLLAMVTSPGTTWHDRGLAFSEHADIYSMPQRAADYICRFVSNKCE